MENVSDLPADVDLEGSVAGVDGLAGIAWLDAGISCLVSFVGRDVPASADDCREAGAGLAARLKMVFNIFVGPSPEEGSSSWLS